MSAWLLFGRILVFAAVATVLHGLASDGLGASVSSWTTSLGAHLSLGVILAFISRSHGGGLTARFTTQFVLVFAVLVVSTAIELLFFSATALSAAGEFVALGAVAAAFYALLSAMLFRPEETETTGALWSGLTAHSAAGWTWRISAGVFSYVVLYLLVGAIAFQFTGPYYTDPSYGLGLTVPSMSTVFLVQVTRSLIFILALWQLVHRFRSSMTYYHAATASSAGSEAAQRATRPSRSRRVNFHSKGWAIR